MIKPPTGGTPTTNMLRHLRKKHQSVYNEVQVNVFISKGDLHKAKQKKGIRLK